MYEEEEESAASRHRVAATAPPLHLAGADDDEAEPHVVRGID